MHAVKSQINSLFGQGVVQRWNQQPHNVQIGEERLPINAFALGVYLPLPLFLVAALPMIIVAGVVVGCGAVSAFSGHAISKIDEKKEGWPMPARIAAKIALGVLGVLPFGLVGGVLGVVLLIPAILYTIALALLACATCGISGLLARAAYAIWPYLLIALAATAIAATAIAAVITAAPFAIGLAIGTGATAATLALVAAIVKGIQALVQDQRPERSWVLDGYNIASDPED